MPNKATPIPPWASVKIEPKRQFKFVLTLGDIPAWVVTDCDRPNPNFAGTVNHEFLGHQFKFPGKLQWSDVSVTLVEPIDPDVSGVVLDAVKKDFLSRLSASIDLGFSFTKANNLRQFSSRTYLGYLSEDWSTDASFDAVRSAQDDVDETKRTDARLGFRYFLPSDWFLYASADFLQNDEQKLILRATPSLGIGNYFVRSNSLYLGGALGVAWTNEEFNDSAKTHRSSSEGVAGLEFNMFNMGDLSLLSNLTVYPSFTESGRVRADFKFDLKYDLPLDFYIRLGYTHNYDSKPVEGAAESDYVLQTSFGWEL